MDCDGGRRKSTRIQHLKSRKRENKSGLNQTAAAKKMKVSRSKPEKSGEIGSAVVENGSIEVKEDIKPVKERVVEPIVAKSVKPSENGTVAVKSAYAKVIDTVRDFNKHFLHFVQEEEIRCRKDESSQKKAKGQNTKGGQKSPGKKISSPKKAEKIDLSKEDTKNRAKRPDLKALTKMTEINAVIKPASRIGNVPGIDVGHKFFSRAEMVVVGFHCHWLNGIDYIGTGDKKGVYKDYTLPLTVCIVISGQYEDDVDNAEKVIYTGQGGNNLLGDKRQIRDQQLLRGNLGLKNSMDQDVPIRVVRGHVYKDGIVGKVYTYDGLYKVEKYWAETGISGFTVYKFELKRLEGQCSLTTEQVNYTRAGVPKSLSEIRGLVCEDISGGKEDLPIPATNLVDDPPLPPTGFTYINKLKISKGVEIPANANGCDCDDDGGGCKDPRSCSCAKLNGRNEFPYVQKDGGRLIEAQGVVFECGPNCGCGPECVNRVSQKGIKHRLEVFKTASKGWGVRSWDTIRSGSMICEYIGVLRKTDELDAVTENSYIFDIDCLQTMKGLEGRERRFRDVSISHLVKDEDKESGPEFCIDAGSTGNVARFINHSCQPNLFVQCILSDHHDVRLARIVLFAADNIPALKELTYDYGYILGSVIGADGKIKEMACYCGTADCRKRLY